MRFRGISGTPDPSNHAALRCAAGLSCAWQAHSATSTFCSSDPRSSTSGRATNRYAGPLMPQLPNPFAESAIGSLGGPQAEASLEGSAGKSISA